MSCIVQQTYQYTCSKSDVDCNINWFDIGQLVLFYVSLQCNICSVYAACVVLTTVFVSNESFWYPSCSDCVMHCNIQWLLHIDCNCVFDYNNHHDTQSDYSVESTRCALLVIIHCTIIKFGLGFMYCNRYVVLDYRCCQYNSVHLLCSESRIRSRSSSTTMVVHVSNATAVCMSITNNNTAVLSISPRHCYLVIHLCQYDCKLSLYDVFWAWFWYCTSSSITLLLTHDCNTVCHHNHEHGHEHVVSCIILQPRMSLVESSLLVYTTIHYMYVGICCTKLVALLQCGMLQPVWMTVVQHIDIDHMWYWSPTKWSVIYNWPFNQTSNVSILNMLQQNITQSCNP